MASLLALLMRHAGAPQTPGSMWRRFGEPGRYLTDIISPHCKVRPAVDPRKRTRRERPMPGGELGAPTPTSRWDANPGSWMRQGHQLDFLGARIRGRGLGRR